jgi:hypothetical protein
MLRKNAASYVMGLKTVLLAVLHLTLFCASAQAQTDGFERRPIVTRYAKTASSVQVDVTGRYFTQVQMQEADHFDGWGVDLDFTVPFHRTMQFRLLLPIYTDGDAREKETHEDIDIHGYGGVFDFATLFFEQQILAESHAGYNLGYYLGFGYRTDRLKTNIGDYYNHRGRNALAGVRADHWFQGPDIHVLGKLGARYYFDSDDLNPVGGDEFWLFEGDAAAVFKPWYGRIYPAVELLYRGIETDYVELSLVPELILAASASVDVKVGGLVGLTNDGEQWGARLQLSGRF